MTLRYQLEPENVRKTFEAAKTLLKSKATGAQIEYKLSQSREVVTVWCDNDTAGPEFAYEPDLRILIPSKEVVSTKPSEAACVIAHEMIHCGHYIDNPPQYKARAEAKNDDYDDAEDQYTITGEDPTNVAKPDPIFENKLRTDFGLPERK